MHAQNHEAQKQLALSNTQKNETHCASQSSLQHADTGSQPARQGDFAHTCHRVSSNRMLIALPISSAAVESLLSMPWCRVLIDWKFQTFCPPGATMTDMPFPLYADGLYEASPAGPISKICHQPAVAFTMSAAALPCSLSYGLGKCGWSLMDGAAGITHIAYARIDDF